MKKDVILIFLISLLPLVFIFTNPSHFYTQDGVPHLARGAAYYKALIDGQFPVRWASDLNYSYGMPLFNYMYQMPYIMMSGFIALGAGLATSLKITALTSFVLSGIFMYLFAYELFKNRQKAFVVTIFYQFFPYHLADMLVRGSMGEMFAFAFFPLILYGVVLFFNKASVASLIIIALGTAGITFSHMPMGSVFLSLTGVFILLFAENIKKILIALSAIIVGLGLSAFYWLSAFLDHKYTYGSLFSQDIYKDHFAPLISLIHPNFFNDPGLRVGNVPIHVGLFHILTIVLALWMFFAVRKIKTFDKKLILFCLGLLTGAFFLMQPVSGFVWQNVPLFEQFQFPWRFLGVIGFATSLLAVYFLAIPLFKKRQAVIGLLVLVIGTTAWYWYPQLGFEKINEEYYWNYPLDTTYYGETNLVWSAGSASEFPKAPVEVIGGEAKVLDLNKQSTRHTYLIDAKTDARVVDHTQYFPGWRVFVDEQEVSIQFQDPSHRGEITYDVPPGKHNVDVTFGETKTRLAANILSIVSAVIIVFLLVLKTVMPNLFRHFIKFRV